MPVMDEVVWLHCLPAWVTWSGGGAVRAVASDSTFIKQYSVAGEWCYQLMLVFQATALAGICSKYCSLVEPICCICELLTCIEIPRL